VSAAEAAASAESIEGGPVASWVGLTGTINGSEAKDALSLPSDTVGELALKYSIYGGALSGPFTACFGGTTAPSGTVTVDAATGNTFNVDLAGNMTSLVVNNPTAWQTITLRFYNGGSARTYAWNTATFKIDGSPLLAANRVNLLTLLWNTGLWEGAWVNVPG
jgi:tetrahydromethanopterin S-methyltransferase subunit C